MSAWSTSSLGGSFLPPTAQSPVEAHHGQELVALGAHETQLRVEVLPLAVEDFEIAGDAAAVADVGQAAGVAGGDGQRLLLHPELTLLAVLHQRVGDVAE